MHIHEDAWLEYASEPSPYPRWLGKWQPARSDRGEGYPRWLVNSEESYLEGIYDNKDRGVCASIMGEPTIKNHSRTRVFIEIGDSSTLRQSHSMMQMLCRTLTMLFDSVPAVLFSANKSYHLHHGIRPLELMSRRYKPVKETVAHIIEQGRRAGLITTSIDWDIGLSDDWRRMGRLPYSLHIKSMIKYENPRYVIPIKPDWSLHRILQESRNASGGSEFTITESENREIRRLLKNTDRALYAIEKVEEDINDKQVDITNVARDINNKYNWLIKRLLENAGRITDGQHRILYHLLVPALRCGNYSWDEAWDVVSSFLLRSGETPSRLRGGAWYWWLRHDEKGKPFEPMSKREFSERYPELSEVLK